MEPKWSVPKWFPLPRRCLWNVKFCHFYYLLLRIAPKRMTFAKYFPILNFLSSVFLKSLAHWLIALDIWKNHKLVIPWRWGVNKCLQNKCLQCAAVCAAWSIRITAWRYFPNLLFFPIKLITIMYDQNLNQPTKFISKFNRVSEAPCVIA